MMKRFFGVVAVIAVVLLPGAWAPAHADGPVRSGTIAAGGIAAGASASCWSSPECNAWRARDCDARLAGRDPAVNTSIVDVGKLAGSRRNLATSAVYEGWIFHTQYEFWSSRCWSVGRTIESYGNMALDIPRGARWMTVSTNFGPYHWELW